MRADSYLGLLALSAIAIVFLFRLLVSRYRFISDLGT
jgi:hypothetical protein